MSGIHLNYGKDVKNVMKRSVPIMFIALTVAFTLLMTTLINDWIMGKTQNTNNTKLIVNLKNRTISVVDTTTNETISTRNFTTTSGNTTLSGNTGNMTTNDTLTEKFNELSK